MTTNTSNPTAPGLTLLGLGQMGAALAGRMLDQGRAVTVWNRTPERAAPLVARGAASAETPAEAIARNGLVVTCLLRYASVRETLDPVAASLRGRTLIDLTTTTPDEARELGRWAAEHDVEYLNGAIMATPYQIGTPVARILYSGAPDVFARHRDLLAPWAEGVYDGPDAGAASLIDLAMLSGMYHMFAGLFHGAAMAATVGMSAQDFASRTIPLIESLVAHFAADAAIIDGGDYSVPGQQSLDFSDLSDILRTSEEAGVDSTTIAAIQALIHRQREAGHGAEGFARIYETLRHPESGRDEATEAVRGSA
ncbi:6-phosphogluconate dehydrogenase [Tsukamurella pulmonis]|uniref:3-hydroxyisobutyrate dehydrogenase n=1 Tax=Tsukamurella pulmonis TaxID=47312 RepID=A0A1H1GN25_9ACTN|nr:NAD(P)-binding domain-containing protein [Tsukamurella pulmonis]KXO88361.1 6-phosphogluconate dehydrogenase [Tsukamurella pulmonis]SDR14298.1 3-hydroxyisobutyrate dehydrogenase [Tsukamurella pulmonis]SUP17028.1 2-hydroxy-3-oxopropionate reductase [Tsukamurella pulmonis]